MQINSISNLFLIGISISIIGYSPVIGDGFSKLSERDKAAIQNLRPKVEGALTHDYMKEDIYLIKFLRAKGMDVEAAADMIRNAMKWRKANKIDNILNEDFSEIHKLAPYYMDGTDLEGGPLVILNNGRWDIRRFAVSGNRDLLTRHWDQMMEKVDHRIREIRNTTNGKDVSQAMIIMDIEGYNLRQQGCFQCLSIFLEWMSHTEQYYPENFKSLNMINTPRIFSPILEILKPAMSPSTRRILHAHGPNKKEWSQILLKSVSADQLPVLYGGTKRGL